MFLTFFRLIQLTLKDMWVHFPFNLFFLSLTQAEVRQDLVGWAITEQDSGFIASCFFSAVFALLVVSRCGAARFGAFVCRVLAGVACGV